ncbi:hypothetical protein SAMN02745148_02716 [Modicisalibacter ilicicola DSM 19980]|uniref:ComF family protein n=1 Tax=Modicisalibacter ilicicola DSM 19980 TaxID=1121942 RepID=A0A1M5BWS9_9GAMM|nr:ComF family protein [Halomonas ilicicola]SHF46865.1 hypothetical protein SAMN02745148_02716 [Halomonas ilicicola DSM 19980]
MQRFKFAGEPRAGKVLVALLGESLDLQRGAPLPGALLALPRHPERAREQGFDPAAWLTRQLARRLEIPCINARRIRPTQTQRGLDRRARRGNVRDAFRVDALLPPQVAVVDDIMTTGASLEALAKSCRDAGARQVEAWAVARTPLWHS